MLLLDSLNQRRARNLLDYRDGYQRAYGTLAINATYLQSRLPEVTQDDINNYIKAMMRELIDKKEGLVLILGLEK